MGAKTDGKETMMLGAGRKGSARDFWNISGNTILEDWAEARSEAKARRKRARAERKIARLEALVDRWEAEEEGPPPITKGFDVGIYHSYMPDEAMEAIAQVSPINEVEIVGSWALATLYEDRWEAQWLGAVSGREAQRARRASLRADGARAAFPVLFRPKNVAGLLDAQADLAYAEA